MKDKKYLRKQNIDNHKEELSYLREEVSSVPIEEQKFVERVVKKAIEDYKPTLDKLAHE